MLWESANIATAVVMYLPSSGLLRMWYIVTLTYFFKVIQSEKRWKLEKMLKCDCYRCWYSSSNEPITSVVLRDLDLIFWVNFLKCPYLVNGESYHKKGLHNNFYKGRYSSSNGTIGNVVFCILTFICNFNFFLLCTCYKKMCRRRMLPADLPWLARSRLWFALVSHSCSRFDQIQRMFTECWNIHIVGYHRVGIVPLEPWTIIYHGPLVPSTIRIMDHWYHELFLSWTIGTMDYSYHGPLVPWTIPIMDHWYHELFLSWTIGTMDYSYHGPLVPWTIRIMDHCYYELFVSWTIGTMYYSYHGPLVPWTIRIMDHWYHVLFVSWTIGTMDYSYYGPLVPWTNCIMDYWYHGLFLSWTIGTMDYSYQRPLADSYQQVIVPCAIRILVPLVWQFQ